MSTIFYCFLSQSVFEEQQLLIKNQATDGADGFIEYQCSYLELNHHCPIKKCSFDPVGNRENSSSNKNTKKKNQIKSDSLNQRKEHVHL